MALRFDGTTSREQRERAQAKTLSQQCSAENPAPYDPSFRLQTRSVPTVQLTKALGRPPLPRSVSTDLGGYDVERAYTALDIPPHSTPNFSRTTSRQQRERSNQTMLCAKGASSQCFYDAKLTQQSRHTRIPVLAKGTSRPPLPTPISADLAYDTSHAERSSSAYRPPKSAGFGGMTSRDQRAKAQTKLLTPQCAASPAFLYEPKYNAVDGHVPGPSLQRHTGRPSLPRSSSADLVYDRSVAHAALDTHVKGAVTMHASATARGKWSGIHVTGANGPDAPTPTTAAAAATRRPMSVDGDDSPVGRSKFRRRLTGQMRRMLDCPPSRREKAMEGPIKAGLAFEGTRGTAESTQTHLKYRFKRTIVTATLGQHTSRDQRARVGYQQEPAALSSARLGPLYVKYSALSNSKHLGRFGEDVSSAPAFSRPVSRAASPAAVSPPRSRAASPGVVAAAQPQVNSTPTSAACGSPAAAFESTRRSLSRCAADFSRSTGRDNGFNPRRR